MNWSTRLQTSWDLLQRSLQVIRSNPRLLLFPVVSTLCTIVLAAFFLLPVFFLAFTAAKGSPMWIDKSDLRHPNVYVYAYGAAIYLISMFVATFFNVAFYNEIMRALGGEPVSLGSGFRFACSKLRAIFLWSLLAGTVGLIIRAIEERLGWIGKIVMGLVGTVWSVAAVFAIPVIIRREDTNPLAVLRDSASTLKRTWGESLAGFVGIRLGGVVLLIAMLGFAAFGLLAVAIFHSGYVLIAAAVLWVLAIIIAGSFVAMASHVYRCALYIYASEGVVPGPFTPELMNAGWKVKKAK